MHRDPDDRKRKDRCAHSRKMGSHTGSRDDHFESPLFRGLCVRKELVHFAVRRNNMHLIRYAQLVKHGCSLRHHGHVRIRAHQNSYFCHFYRFLLSSCVLSSSPQRSSGSFNFSVPGRTNLPFSMRVTFSPSLQRTVMLPSSS